MELERVSFLAVAWATHGVVGYALVRAFTGADPRVGAALALVPDVDFLLPAAWEYPFVHRGITHTPAFALVAISVAYGLRRDRAGAVAAGLAVGSHLAVDSLSPTGIAWLYPFGGRTGLGVAVHGHVATALLWAAAAALVVLSERGRTRRHTADRSRAH